MSIKEKATEIFKEIRKTNEKEDGVVHETTKGTRESIRKAFDDQQQIINKTAEFEEELNNLLVSDHGNVLDKAEEFIAWEKEIADTFRDMLWNETLSKVVDQLNEEKWDELEGTEHVLASKLRALEQERERITSDMSKEEVETIEYLLDDDQVIDDIKSLHDLVEEETREEQLIQRSSGEEKVWDQGRELQQVRVNFRNLIEMKNRIQRLRKKRKKALKSSKKTVSETLRQIRTVRNAIPSDKESKDHDFELLTAVLQDYDKLATRIHPGNQGKSRRDFLKTASAGIEKATYGATLIDNLKELENQLNEKIGKTEIKEPTGREETDRKELDKQKGKIDSEDNPFQIEYLIQNTEHDDKVLELKITNTGERKVDLNLSFAIPSRINLHGGLNIEKSSSGLISSDITLEPGETEEVGISYRRTKPGEEAVAINMDYTFNQNNWYQDRLNATFNDTNIEEMTANQGVIEREDQNFRIKWRTLETFLDKNKFINLELVAEPINTTRTVELEYDIHVANNWLINGQTEFNTLKDRSTANSELHLETDKKQDREKLPLFPNGKKLKQISLQKAANGKNTAEIHIKTRDGQKTKEIIQLT